MASYANGNGYGRRAGRGLPRRQRRSRHAAGFALPALALMLMGLLLASLLVAITAIQAGMAVYASFSSDLPPVDGIADRETFKTVHIYDRYGTLLWEFWDPAAGMRTPVPLNQVSQYVIDATLAAEDAHFYDNPGVDFRGILRAAIQNFTQQDIVSGASTITQQLVRNVLLPPEERYQQTITRKLKEAVLAFRLTQEYPKDRILEMYLNEINYGNMAYGVEAAAQTYFNKHARDLTLAEAALIAGLPQAPSLYDPYRNAQAALERRAYVLDQMARHGFITEQEATQAKREPLNLSAQKVELKAPHLVNFVRQQLEERYGPDIVYRSGLKVFTSLDLGLQEALEEVARSNRDYLATRDANNTAIIAVNPKTGEILAMVGSMDYWDSNIDGQVNVLTSERQPGSSIKPLVYMTAFTKGWNPSTIVSDSPTCWTTAGGGRWCPVNFDFAYRGAVTIRTALGNSLNIPAVKTLEFAGLDTVKEMARRVGITTWDDKKHVGLSLTLGGAEVKPIELAGLYATLANNGLRIPLVAITRVVDANGNVLDEYRVPPGTQVVDPRAAYMVTSILSDNNARLITFGPNSLINLPRPAAVKTGTTDNYRDTWTFGYTPNLVVGVWVGNTDGHPMERAVSSLTAGKVWRESMDIALSYLNLPAEPFPKPDGLVEREVCGLYKGPNAPPCGKEVFMAEQAPRLPRIYLGQPAATPTPRATPAPQATPAGPTATPPAGPTAPATTRPAGTPTADRNGQPVIEMPVVRGMRQEEARAQLERMGLAVQIRTIKSTWPQGIVADQSPREGTALKPGDMVTLAISDGSGG